MHSRRSDPTSGHQKPRTLDPGRAHPAHRASTATLLTAGLSAVTAAILSPASARAQFVEPDVAVTRLFIGDQAGDIFGWVGAHVPDLDGDGVQEILIPAIGHDAFAGRATLYSGRTGRILNDVVGPPGALVGYSVAAAGDVDADGTADYVIGGGIVAVYSGRTHAVILDLTATTGFGSAVSEAGDVNADGYDDVVVGAQTTSTSTTQGGRVYLISGRDGSVLWTRDGAAAGDLLGSAAGRVGDVDRDGRPDVVVGAFGAGPAGGGEAYVLSGADGRLVHRLEPVDPSEAVVFGRFFASGAGDVDGDRVPDVFVADYAEGTGPRQGTGRAYVYSGRTGHLVHVFTGFDPGDGFGPGRGIPDVNGDGHADVIVAAYLDGEGAPGAGAAYLFSGRSGALLRRITATRAQDNFGVDALSVGDTDGDAIPDFLVTAAGRSFAGTEPGRAYLIAGIRLPCVADLNGNGWVGPFDLLRVRRAIGSSGGSEDLDGNGIVDFRDFVVAIRELGRCPAGVP